MCSFLTLILLTWRIWWAPNHHHRHIFVMELDHLLTRSGLTYPEVSSKVCHDSFCQLGNSVSLSWVICYRAFYLHVISSFFCIPVICLKLVLFLIPLQFVRLFCNVSGFFPWDLPVVKISPEWVTGPEQGKSSGRIATFSLCTACLGMAFPPFLMKQLYRCDSVVISSFVRTGYTTDDWWVG